MAMKEKIDQKKRRFLEILNALKEEYPEARCALVHKNPFELLVATMLSAQCTDRRVNMVTPELFRKYPDPSSMAEAPLEDLEQMIRSTNYYKSKAQALKTTSRSLVDQHAGQVPASLEALVELRGVGRKTANVVLGNAFGVPSVVVDTHVGRILRRWGMTNQEDPVKIEKEVMELLDPSEWTLMSHLLIEHGRTLCKARAPLCDQCLVRDLCPFFKKK